MYFNDRKEAGRILAERLQRFRGKNTVVLALPGGSVVVGSEVAKALDAPFGIVFVRKIAHPTERVYAIGAIAEGGEVVYESAEINNFSDSWRRDAENAARMSLMYRRKLYTAKGYSDPSIRHKTAILVCQGITTGVTTEAAAYSLHGKQPDRVIVAAPVASHEGIDRLQEIANGIVTVDDPKNFIGINDAHYLDSPRVNDDETLNLLNSSKRTIRKWHSS
jgi:putative phosphoribosyl transferase